MGRRHVHCWTYFDVAGTTEAGGGSDALEALFDIESWIETEAARA